MSVMSKFESKRSKTLDFIAYSIFKGFDQKSLIIRATFLPRMAINFKRNYKDIWNSAKCAIMCIIKVKEFQVCAYLRLKSVEENIKDLHQVPPE